MVFMTGDTAAMSAVWESNSTGKAVERVLQSRHSGCTMDDPFAASIVRGQLTPDLIPLPSSRFIRVYVCSCPTDSCTERTAFVEQVYPKLREYCRNRYDVEFQVVDLRWGYSPELSQTDGTFLAFKMEEIRKCQKTSIGPSFIALLGQKYGPRHLPVSVPATELDPVLAALQAHKSRDTRNAPLLAQCYVLDTNSLPPVYVLRRDLGDLCPGLNSDDLTERQEAEQNWQQLQTELFALLQKGAQLAYLEATIDSDVRAKFAMSDLEKEVQLGLENCDQPRKRCVLVLRDIVDLKNYVTEPRAARFVDLTLDDVKQTYAVDAACERCLEALRARARGLVSEANTLHGDVLWRYDDVVDPVLHKEYLEQLCEGLRQTLQRLVDDSVPAILQQQRPLPAPAREPARHWTRCRQVCRDFFPSQPQLQQLRDYVTSARSGGRPLVVHGPTGCGKTVLVSKLALELSEMVPDNLVAVVRYVGLTSQSGDLRHLLQDIVRQLVCALGCSPDQVPPDFRDLKRFFPEFVHALPPEYQVVLILDGLEQLSPDHEAHELKWLPLPLPDRVKMVLTVSPDQHGLLERLQKEVLRECPEAFVFVQPLALPDAQVLLSHYLRGYDRQISPEQLASLADRMLKYCQPLYVKLIAEQAKLLHSFSDASQIQVPADCLHGIQQFFDRLQAEHGYPVVSRCLAYMAASGTGLSDLEMEDLLSLDDTVLNHIYRDYHPRLRRAPCRVWLELRRDLEAFLLEREADGVLVTGWAHRAFAQVARARYLDPPEGEGQGQGRCLLADDLHSLLADYFLGTWAGRPKPLSRHGQLPAPAGRLPPSLFQAPGRSQLRAAVPPCGDPANRLVPAQPLTFPSHDSNAETRFNRRMLEQVPRHLDLSNRHREMVSLVLFNYQWLYSKIKALSLSHVLADFALDSGPQAQLVAEALRAAAPLLERDLNCLPAELTGRLLPYHDTFANIRDLIKGCDLQGLQHCALLPSFPYLQVPGSSLQFTLENGSLADFLGLVFEERYLLTKKTEESLVRVFDLLTGELKSTIVASSGELHLTPDGLHFLVVDHVTEKSIKIHASGDGAFLGQIILLKHLGSRCDVYKAGPLALTNDRVCGIVHTADSSILFISELPSGRMLQIVLLDGKGAVCGILPGGQHVMCNSNDYVIVYDLYTLQQVCCGPLSHRPIALTFTADGRRAYLACEEEHNLTVLKLNQGQVEMTYKASLTGLPHADLIRALCVSPNDQYVLVRTDQHLMVHKRATECVVAHFSRPEQVPSEFRLPKHNYQDLVFTNAAFTRDSSCVIATIFRNIYIWQISNSQLLCSKQAPIGIIKTLLVCKNRGQVITNNTGSTHIHVWSRLARRAVQRLDRLTAPVQRVLVTSDCSLAFVQCRNSDEVGVIDMRSGALVDLLTHDSKVEDLAITPSGQVALVTTRPRLSNTACKLWSLPERSVLAEFGSSAGHCAALHHANTLLLLHQPEPLFHSPWDLSLLHLMGASHTVHHLAQACQYARARPVVTWDDRSIVVNCALGYSDRLGQYLNPCLVVLDMTGGLKRACYDAGSLGLEGVMEDILDVQPCQKEVSSVAVLVACRRRADPEKEKGVGEEREVELGTASSTEVINMPRGTTALSRWDLANLDLSASMENFKARQHVPELAKKEAERQVGLIILDVRLGCITAMTFMEPSPQAPFPPRMVFSPDLTLCMDEASCLYDLAENTAAARGQPDPSVKGGPQCLALQGQVAVYVSDTELWAVRLRDWATLGRLDVHARICHVALAPDQRTLLVGCADGSLASYVIVDPASGDDPEAVRRLLPNRQPDSGGEGRFRAWDKVQEQSAPPYSRPPSACSPGSRERLILQQIPPVPRLRPTSDTLLYVNGQTSRACCVM